MIALGADRAGRDSDRVHWGQHPSLTKTSYRAWREGLLNKRTLNPMNLDQATPTTAPWPYSTSTNKSHASTVRSLRNAMPSKEHTPGGGHTSQSSLMSSKFGLKLGRG